VAVLADERESWRGHRFCKADRSPRHDYRAERAGFSHGDLEPRLAALADEDPRRVLYVCADRTVTYAELMHPPGLVNRAGFGKVSLVAQADLSK
jgi:biopolymer transport protein ExbD